MEKLPEEAFAQKISKKSYPKEYKEKDKRYLKLLVFVCLGVALFVSISDYLNPVNNGSSGPIDLKVKQTGVIDSPKLLGKWFGKRNIYLGTDGSTYVAEFDPSISTESLALPAVSSDPIYPYLVGLLNEVWGILPSDVLSPKIESPYIVYYGVNGEIYYFLVFKDDSTKMVSGVSFWKK